MQHHVFLSYNRHDTAIMERVRAYLNSEGLSVWIDQTGIEPGTPNWRRAIQDALDAVGCLVVIFSPDAKQSRWVGEEMNYVETRRLKIFPILARGDEETAVPFGYTTAQWVDIRDDARFAPEMQKLVTTICKHLEIESASQRKAREAAELERQAREEADHLAELERQRQAKEEADRLVELERQRKAKEEAERQTELERQRRDAILKTLPKLIPWNPLDQFRWLWWLFIRPDRLDAYEEIFGDEATVRVGKWLASALIWMPLFIPAVANGLGALASPAIAWLLVVLACWLVTRWILHFRSGAELYVSFIAVSGVVGIVSFGVEVNLAVVVAVGMAVGVATGVATMITISATEDKGLYVMDDLADTIAGAVAGGAAVGAAVGAVASGVVANVVFAMAADVANGVVAGLVAGGIAGGIAGGFVAGTARVGESINDNWQSSLLRITIFILLILSYAALIWIYLLGGWRVLSGW